MSDFQKFMEEQFFIIDSNHLDNINSKLCGYTIQDGEVYEDATIDYESEESYLGAYVHIRKTDDEISLTQDMNGSFGIYMYQSSDSKDYFVISNSFLKLVMYLKDKLSLNLNYDYASAFLTTNMCSFSYKETMVQEIKRIPRNWTISIDLKSKKIEYTKIDFEENTVSLDSEEGIKLLDSWFNRWVKIIRRLYSQRKPIFTDLSGGFDSRLLLTLFLCADIDLNNINVNSHINEFQKEDYEIASSIANYFEFQLNNRLPVPIMDLDMSDCINLSFYIKLGFHKQLYYKNFRYISKIYQFSGAVSSNIRPYWIYSVKKHKKNVLNRVKRYNKSMVSNSENIIDASFAELRKDFNIADENSIQLPGILYREVRGPNHYGKSSVESYMSNIIDLSPLIDPDLVKIKLTIDDCDANDLLIAMIFLRYCPDLLNFKFDHGREIDSESIKMAKLINDKFPLNVKKRPNISLKPIIPEVKKDNLNIQRANINLVNDLIKQSVTSKYFEKLFKIYFSEAYYIKLVRNINNQVLFPLQDAHASLAVILILELIKYSKNNGKNEILDWISVFSSEKIYSDNLEISHEVMSYLINFLTGRIDIKNFGDKKNRVELLEISDTDAWISKPKWFSDSQGAGVITQSNSCDINFKIKCHNDGKLKLFLRSIDYRDKNGERIPIYIEFLDLIIDGENIFRKKVCSYVKPFIYEADVYDSQIISFQVKWRPINKFSTLN